MKKHPGVSDLWIPSSKTGKCSCKVTFPLIYVDNKQNIWLLSSELGMKAPKEISLSTPN